MNGIVMGMSKVDQVYAILLAVYGTLFGALIAIVNSDGVIRRRSDQKRS
jgi:hypothetical protein